MKTPDEIKKGLQYCSENTWCVGSECPYYEITDCDTYIAEDALALIGQLERERDAAVEDIQKATIYLCQVCKKYHPAQKDVHPHYCEELGSHPDYGGAIACSMFEWRGIQEEV